jgi:hypothetical protein
VSKVKGDLLRTNQENQIIYYAEVPTHLPPLEERLAVKVEIPAELQDSKQTFGGKRRLFEGLLGIGAQKAIGTAIFLGALENIILRACCRRL